MGRSEDVDRLLRRLAPLFHDVATNAQAAAEELLETDWAATHLHREAARRQVSGTARWRIAGDQLSQRHGELPEGVTISTSDSEQNAGRYAFDAADEAAVVTIRRHPHKKDEEPEYLQLRIGAILEAAPIDYGKEDGLTIYLEIPQLGVEPRFEVVRNGNVIRSVALAELLGGLDSGAGDDDAPVTPMPSPPRKPGGGAQVGSSKVPAEEEGTSDDTAN
jgi:hypothetical protein